MKPPTLQQFECCWNVAQTISSPWVLVVITCTCFQVYCELFTDEVVGKSEKVAVFGIKSVFHYLIDNISASLHSGICVVLYLRLMCWTQKNLKKPALGWAWLALPPLGKKKMLPFKRIIWTDFTALQYKIISSADKLVFLMNFCYVFLKTE